MTESPITGEQVALTEAEQEALDRACSGAGEYMCCYRGIHRKTGQPVGGAMLDAVERIIAARVAEAKAEAWDEGAHSVGCDLGDCFMPPNPYRAEAPQ